MLTELKVLFITKMQVSLTFHPWLKWNLWCIKRNKSLIHLDLSYANWSSVNISCKRKTDPKQHKKGNAAYMTEVNSFNAVAHLVQWRWPAHQAHDVRNNQKNPTSNSRFRRKTNLQKKIENYCSLQTFFTILTQCFGILLKIVMQHL